MSKKKKLIKVDGENYVTFLNDSDGFSAKDYILILSTGVFFIFITIGLVMLLFNRELNPMYLDLLEMVMPVLITVVGGVMGVQAVETFSNRNKKEESPTKNNDEDVYL